MTATAHTDVPSTSDDLATEILRKRRKKLPRLTAALAIAVALGAGVVGGIEIQKHYGGSSTSSGTGGGAAAFASRFGNGRTVGFGGFGRPGGGAGGVTAGTVTLIRGSTLYVTDASGNTVMVRTSPSSRVTKTVAGTVRTIHPGDAVTVTGTRAGNGSYTASTITIAGATNNG